LRGVDRARIVGWRVDCRGAEIITAGREAVQAKFSEIVGLRASAGGRQSSEACDELVSVCRDSDVCERLSEIIRDAAADGPRSNQSDVELFANLVLRAQI